MNNINKVRQNLKEQYERLDQELKDLEQFSMTNSQGFDISNEDDLKDLFKQKRIGISLEDLVLQTGIPSATINRVLSNPMNAKVKNLTTIANELGIKIWIEK